MRRWRFQQVAVLGAGAMGTQIAAHFANAGYSPILFDLPAHEGDTNAIPKQSIQDLKKLKPNPLADMSLQNVIQAANYEEDLHRLSSCDLIIEAISERFDWKEALYQKIMSYLNQNVVLVTNTSGLSIRELASTLPSILRSQFLGVHFFNPPRYMKLVEIVPHEGTHPDLVDALEVFLVHNLGKGVVRAKDTPNFIGNRVGVFSILATMHYAHQYHLTPDKVDVLTGRLIGRPKSATFRTLDLVGLDTIGYVVDTMKNNLQDDPWHSFFSLPSWLLNLINKGHLGQKSGAGVYKKTNQGIMVIDAVLATYRHASQHISDELMKILKKENITDRFQSLKSSSLPEAKFLFSVFMDLFHYCAYHFQTIAYHAIDIDLVFKWGFGWKQGPFELWHQIGWSTVTQWLNERIYRQISLVQAPLPEWVLSQGLNIAQQKISALPIYRKQYYPKDYPASVQFRETTLFEHQDVECWTIDQKNILLSFNTKKNTITQEVLSGIHEALMIAERQYQSLILWQKSQTDFSLGVNLKDILSYLEQGNFTKIEEMITFFQQTALRLRYSSVPTIAVLTGRVLGGGCELAMHCHYRVSAFESYIGLVEPGVGLIPSGAGSKEMALRASLYGTDILHARRLLSRYFEQLIYAKPTQSAIEAKNMYYLVSNDLILMNELELLDASHQLANYLSQIPFKVPTPPQIQVQGKTGIALFQSQLINLKEGYFISEHDYFIGSLLARVLCGGEIEEGQWVSEEWFLDLERDAMISLLKTDKTMARIKHTLVTGKLLRN